jgi:hypothetical protein
MMQRVSWLFVSAPKAVVKASIAVASRQRQLREVWREWVFGMHPK